MTSMKAIVLCAGYNSRMQSSYPKCLHKIKSRPIVSLLLEKIHLYVTDIYLVVSPAHKELFKKELVCPDYAQRITYITQNIDAKYGTAAAVESVLPLLDSNDDIMIVYGNLPLLDYDNVTLIADRQESNFFVLSKMDNPKGRNRAVVSRTENIEQILDERELSDDDKKRYKHVFHGISRIKVDVLRQYLHRILPQDNEYDLKGLIDLYPFHAFTLPFSHQFLAIKTTRDVRKASKLYELLYLRRTERFKTLDFSSIKNKPRIIIIGDIHGMYASFTSLLEKIKYNETKDILISVGDLLNKGPNSEAVIKWFSNRISREDNGISNTSKIFVVRGNHEERALSNIDYVRKKYNLREFDIEFMRMLPYAIILKGITECGEDVVVVHAGVNPLLGKLEDNDNFTLTNIRFISQRGESLSSSSQQDDNWTTKYNGQYGFVVFGHNAINRLQFGEHYLGIDTGCCYGDKLTALIFEDGEKKLMHYP